MFAPYLSRLILGPLLRGPCPRPFGSTAASRSPAIFDSDAKLAQRERAAHLIKHLGRQRGDPLVSVVADRLLDRMDDCTRTFPTIAVLGGAGPEVARRLRSSKAAAAIQKVLHLDASPGVLARIQEQEAIEGGSWEAEYRLLQGEVLPLEPESVDLVVSCLHLHWVNDLETMMLQCRLALKPDGLLLAALWGGETLQELRIAASLAQQEQEGGVSPVVSPLVQMRDAGSLLTAAGLALPAVDTDTFEMRYPSPAALVDHLRMMGETNAVATRRRMMRRSTAAAMMGTYQSQFGDADGSIPATFQAMFLVGWAPHESQQRPKARGSATVSFQDLAAELEKKGATVGGSGSEGTGGGPGSGSEEPSSSRA